MTLSTGISRVLTPFVAGIYPLLPDETCWFLAIDFDKRGWRENVSEKGDAC
ncbi:TOTE conflict system archaeo-eukaryotic primase domain-containing protein [Sedimenticola sp.]|uniref:TOTE conflict system archaeo-eukaryotic primase domain-containing protein n=1 Tax=Sedimenticola sp. TaxID=1940285 RepID=UPI003D0E78B2